LAHEARLISPRTSSVSPRLFQTLEDLL